MDQIWHSFADRVPQERRYVLVMIDADDAKGMPPSVAVGYLRHRSSGPWFVVPGFGRDFTVTHWCDCLGDDFKAPLWAAQGPNRGTGEMTVALMQALMEEARKHGP